MDISPQKERKYLDKESEEKESTRIFQHQSVPTRKQSDLRSSRNSTNRLGHGLLPRQKPFQTKTVANEWFETRDNYTNNIRRTHPPNKTSDIPEQTKNKQLLHSCF